MGHTPVPTVRGSDELSAAESRDIERRDTTPGELAKRIRSDLEDMKAEELVEIDLRGKTSLADTMIIATGRSNRHVASIAEHTIESLKRHGHGPVRNEGLPHGDWVLIDAGDVIVHIFRPEVRGFYNLEKMWGADRPGERIAAG